MITTPGAPPRGPLYREWAACGGMALVLTALVLWTGSGGFWRVFAGWIVAGALVAFGGWLEQRAEALRNFGRIVIAGGLAGLYGVTFGAHCHGAFWLVRPAWLACVLLAFIAGWIAFAAGQRRSQWLGAAGLALAWLAAALEPFRLFHLATIVIVSAVAAWFLIRHAWTTAAWVTLAVIYLGYLVWWPYSEGRIDADRYLALDDYRTTRTFFFIAWALFAAASSRARDDAFSAGRRVGFATLNNALFYALGVLILPPRYPDWFWKFTVIFGLALLVASTLAKRFADVRRGYLVQGALLVLLGIVSALTGRNPALMLAVASVFFVLTATRREDWLLRDLAFAAGLLAVIAAGISVRGDAANGLRIGVLTGALLLFDALWISRRRELWECWSVAVFTAFALAVWLVTTIAQTPEIHRAPVLALEAILLTASFATLGVREIPWLAKAFVLAAQIVWFMQIGAFTRPWWNPFLVILATLGISFWWQTRGRTLLPAWELRWVQGVAAAASVAILILWIDGAFGAQPAALPLMSALALVLLAYAVAIRDWFLAGFSQLLTAAAVGEFIGQHGHVPLPGALAALAPIIALPLMSPMIRGNFTDTEWEKPARIVCALYGVLSAAMFVVWVMHYVSPANRFLTLAVAGMFLLLCHVSQRPRGPLLASLVCETGALLVFWLGWTGVNGFRVRDLLAFILMLGYGALGRRLALLPPMIPEIGIVVGLASVVHWVTLWTHVHFPAWPVAVVWAIVAAIIMCFGWWLREALYRGIAWALLIAALGCVLWMDLQAPRDLRLGLLAVGAAALVIAFSYARRPAELGK